MSNFVCVHLVVVVPPPPTTEFVASAAVATGGAAAVEELVIGGCGGDANFKVGAAAAPGSAATDLSLSSDVDTSTSPVVPSAATPTTVGAEMAAAATAVEVAPETTAAGDMTAVAAPATSTSDASMPTFSLSGPPPPAATAAAAATRLAAVPLLERVDLFLLLPLLDLALLEPPWWWWCSWPWWPWRWWCDEDEETPPLPTSEPDDGLPGRECPLSSLLVRLLSLFQFCFYLIKLKQKQKTLNTQYVLNSRRCSSAESTRWRHFSAPDKGVFYYPRLP